MGSNLESSVSSAETLNVAFKPASKSDSNTELSASHRTTVGDSSNSDSNSIATASSTNLTSATSMADIKALSAGSDSDSIVSEVPGIVIDESTKPNKMPYMSSIYTALSTGIGPEKGDIKLASLNSGDSAVPKLNLVQAEADTSASQKIDITNPFPELKLVKDGKNGLVVDNNQTKPSEAAAEKIPAFTTEPEGIANSNRKIVETAHQELNKKPWQNSKYAEYLEGGKLAGATSVSEVLKKAGFKFQDSANPANLVKRLIAEGWTMHGVKQAQAGDLVFGGKHGTNWRKGANNADVGIVAADGKHIYHNDKGSGNWTASQLEKVFSEGEYAGQVWVLRPPKEIPTHSNYKPGTNNSSQDRRDTSRPNETNIDQSIINRRIVIDKDIPREDRPYSTPESYKPDDRRQDNPESSYWSDYWKGYWNNYWRDYWREHYSKRPGNDSNYKPQGNGRSDLVPPGWDYNQHNRRQDANYPQGRVDDRYLPPEWRNDGWRRGDGSNYRPNDNSNNYPTNGRNARIVPHRPGNMNMLGPPTITPQKINEVLRQYNSPAQGMGQLVFDLGVKHGINPAIALAFFVKESGAGTAGVAVHTKNWGNRKGRGPAGSYKGFIKYNNFEESLRDWFPYIHRVYINQGRKTLPTIIAKYAPGYDNNDERGYVRTVDRLLRKWSV